MNRKNIQTIFEEYRRKAILDQGELFLRVPLAQKAEVPDTTLRSAEAALAQLTRAHVAIKAFPEYLEFRILGGDPGTALQAMGAMITQTTDRFLLPETPEG